MTGSELETAIESLRSLPYRTGGMAGRHWGNRRHQLCSFPSKIKPSIAATLVELFSWPGATVFDPFSGSGTIPFEAALQGRIAIGSDISPLAFVISSGKVDPPTMQEVSALLAKLEDEIESTISTNIVDDMEDEIREFFHPKTANEILKARLYFERVTERFTTNRAGLFLTTCLAHVLHGNRPYAISRRSHNIIPIPPKGPTEYKSVLHAVRNKAERMLHFDLPSSFKSGTVYLNEAANSPLKNQSVDVVITSPPFLGTTNFLRQNRLRNWLVGWSYEQQIKMRPSFLEHDVRWERYLPIAGEITRITRPGSILIFHLGMVGKTDMTMAIGEIFVASGFQKLDVVWENVNGLESHGRTDRGATNSHGFMILKR